MELLPGPSGRILALHTDGITTTGAVFRRLKGSPDEVARVSALNPDPSAALAEILQKLKSEGVKVPARVILATDRAALSRAELPVHPQRPRPYDQMRELARWESEVAFSDLPSWTVKDILAGMGAVTPPADQRIRHEIEQRTSQILDGPAPRYQDVALDMGIIDRATRDAAVAFRENLNQPPGDAGCGWSPVTQNPGDDFVQHNWMLSALSEYDRQAWRDACKLNKLSLIGILPSWGLTELKARKAQLESKPDVGSRLLLERHSGAIALLHLNEEEVESVRLVNLNRPDSDETETLHRILDGREQARITASGFSWEARPVIRAAFPGVEILEETLPAVLAGAAARGLGIRRAPDWPPLIAKEEPRPPIWQRENFYRIAMVVAVIIGIGTTDAYTRWQKSRFEARSEELDAEFEERREIKNQIQSAVNAARALEGKLDETAREIEDLRARAANAAYLQERRHQTVSGLLYAIRDAIPKGVVMREIKESRKSPEVFTLTAWALTDIDAERFIAQLNERLADLGLVVANEGVFKEQGPQNLDGYGARLRIVPQLAAEAGTEDGDSR